MKRYCKYHPARPAHWYCEKCNTDRCPECVDARDMGGYHQGEKLHMCPQCNRPVQWLGIENIIDPFWKRFPRFFIYPFSFRPLMLMLALAISATLGFTIGIFGLIVLIGVMGVAFKYAYSILQATASGDLTPPKLGGPTLTENFAPVIKQIGIYIAIGFAAGFVQSQLGTTAHTLFILIAMFLVPSMIILLVTTESLIAAINPMMFIPLAVRIGWGYLAMYLLIDILALAPFVLYYYLIQYLPEQTHLFIVALSYTYYTFVTYHLMGYVILQYHQQIGYRVDFDDYKDEHAEKTVQQPTSPHDQLLRNINQLIKDGDHEGAIRLIEAETDPEHISDPLLSQRYFALLGMTGAKEKLAAHGSNHLELLVRSNNAKDAAKAYLQCMAADPSFTPSPTALLKVGGWLDEAGKSKEAIGAFSRLTKVYPQDPLVPKAYFRAAQIFNDRLMKPEKAKKILAGLQKKYAHHDIIPFVERYLQQMG